ncbi:DUF7563 family protein [Natronorubrum tibetense]
MPTCSNCEEYVTSDFVRVFGMDGAVDSCPNCSTYRELQNGSGAEHSLENRTGGESSF